MTATYTYTPIGNRATIVDAQGTTTLTYNARDRLVAHADPDGITLSYTYDAAGNRLSVSSPSGVIFPHDSGHWVKLPSRIPSVSDAR